MVRRPRPLGPRGATVLLLLAAGLGSTLALGLTPSGLLPGEGGLRVAGRFLLAALHPALDYPDGPHPDWIPFGLKVAQALWRTVAFAVAGMSLALLIGLPLGLLASQVWWREECLGGGILCAIGRPLLVTVRILIALMRSVHELLWAVLFLAAFGLNTFAAVVAIAIPYGGTLAKVFSEMLDEAPRDTVGALRDLGAAPLSAVLFGLLPRALPDLWAYTFYRFECSLRSSAVLGFFGYPTLGYHLELAFRDAHFREVWTYVYALIALVLLLEAWSAALRRRVVA